MSLFANCREKFKKDAYPYGTYRQKNGDIAPGEINPYWEGNLTEANKEYVAGFDAGVDAVKAFFDNWDDDDFKYSIREEAREELIISLQDSMEATRNEIITSLIDSQRENP